jgi:hypothetical protein
MTNLQIQDVELGLIQVLEPANEKGNKETSKAIKQYKLSTKRKTKEVANKYAVSTNELRIIR